MLSPGGLFPSWSSPRSTPKTLRLASASATVSSGWEFSHPTSRPRNAALSSMFSVLALNSSCNTVLTSVTWSFYSTSLRSRTARDGSTEPRTATLLEYGNPNGYQAMAKTVGVPCGIATQLILDGKLTIKGVIAPMTPEIYEPLIELIEKEDISCIEAVLLSIRNIALALCFLASSTVFLF